MSRDGCQAAPARGAAPDRPDESGVARLPGCGMRSAPGDGMKLNHDHAAKVSVIDQYLDRQVERGIRRESARMGLDRILSGHATPDQIDDLVARDLAQRILEVL